MLDHGGRLLAAAKRYGIPPDQWLDLSTGINPTPYPLPPVPQQVWSRLPEPDDSLLAIAADYYGTTELLPSAGSQPAIQALPYLRATGRVGVLQPAYAEHAHAWSRAGHDVRLLPAGAIEAALPTLDVLVVINPNNPTGERFSPERLLEWRARLARDGGWLVVDEAFLDARPDMSLAAYVGQPGLIVLRSLGKFFGLAGARAGVVLAWGELLERLGEALGPWHLSGPARFAARHALGDRAWQQAMRADLPRQAERLRCLLAKSGIAVTGQTELFAWCRTPRAAAFADRLARRGILVRRFYAPDSLRLGLPGAEHAWQWLESALKELAHEDGV